MYGCAEHPCSCVATSDVSVKAESRYKSRRAAPVLPVLLRVQEFFFFFFPRPCGMAVYYPRKFSNCGGKKAKKRRRAHCGTRTASNVEPKEAQDSKDARRSGVRQDDCDSAVCLVVATLSLRTRAGLPPHIWRSLATVRWQGLEYWHARKEWREWGLHS